MDCVEENVSKKFINVSIANICWISVILFLNVYGTKVNNVDLVLIVYELIGILFLLKKGRLVQAYQLLFISLSCVLEVSSFVYAYGSTRPLYSIVNIPKVSIFPFYVLCIFMCIISFRKKYNQYISCYPRGSAIRKVTICFPIMLVTGFLIGLLTILFNDNGVADYSWVTTALIATSIRILALICFIFTGALLIAKDKEAKKLLESSFVELLFSYVLVGTITVFLGWHGFYGNNEAIMLMPLACSLCPMLIVIPSFYSVRRPYLFYVAAVLFTIETLFYNSLMGSKFYLIPLLGIMVAVVTSYMAGRIKAFLFSIIIIFLFIIGFPSIMDIISDTHYGSWKFSQFVDLFSISSGDAGLAGWYSTMAESPRFRIDEWVNIFLEYVRKPWLALLGKGNAGSVKHVWGTTNWYNSNGAFSQDQINSGIYINMHESLNVIFLRHGLFGLFFFFSAIKDLIKRLFKSPWALGGLIWLLFYWGIYVSWWIGALMFIIALSDDTTN